MSSKKISELTNLVTSADDDVIAIVDTSAEETKKITKANFLKALTLKANVLELDNTDAFTPDADYEPATKKYVDDQIGGINEFTELTDTPANYTDDGLKVVRVNEGETALEFLDISTSEVDEGTNLYYTSARFNTAFSGKSTTDLSEGTNLYYTDARVQTYSDGRYLLLDGETNNVINGTFNLTTTGTGSFNALTLTGDTSVISSAYEIDIKPNDDADDYIRFDTVEGITRMQAVGGDLYLFGASNVVIPTGSLTISAGNLTVTGTLDVTGDTQLGNSTTADTVGINVAPDANNLITASFSETGANTAANYFLKGTFADSGDFTSADTYNDYGYYLDFDVSNTLNFTGDTLIHNVYGSYIDLESTSDLRPAYGGSHQILYGYYADVFWNGTFIQSNSGAEVYVYGGYFSGTGKEIAEGTLQHDTYGIKVVSAGDLGTTAITKHYGAFISSTGTADNNYGIWLDDVTGASANYGIVIDSDDVGLTLGNAQDVTIKWDGSATNFGSSPITTSGKLEAGSADIGDGTNELQISSTGVVTLAGTAKRDLTLRADLDYTALIAGGKPTQVVVGVFHGYSMPIWAADPGGEELFFNENVPGRWDGASDITFDVLVALALAETAGETFKFQFSWNQVGETDVVPATTHDTTDEIIVVDGTQYATYMLQFTIDYNADAGDPIIPHDDLAGRLRRVASTGDEVDGEVIVLDWHTHYTVDKMFKAPE